MGYQAEKSNKIQTLKVKVVESNWEHLHLITLQIQINKAKYNQHINRGIFLWMENGLGEIYHHKVI